MRGVGDERALALERRLGLDARRLERAEHLVERSRQLGDLVLGRSARGPRGRGSRVRAMSRAVAVSSVIGRSERLASASAAEQREQRAGEHAEREEQRARRAIVF